MGELIGIARRAGKRAAMEELDAADIGEASGVAADFRGRPGKRQVTVLAEEAWLAACDVVGRTLPWTTRRANLLVRNIALPQRAGDLIVIGDAVLEVTMETDPCYRMDEQCAGLKEALTPDWRGGVSCKVRRGGAVRLGDTVEIVPVDSGAAQGGQG